MVKGLRRSRNKILKGLYGKIRLVCRVFISVWTFGSLYYTLGYSHIHSTYILSTQELQVVLAALRLTRGLKHANKYNGRWLGIVRAGAEVCDNCQQSRCGTEGHTPTRAQASPLNFRCSSPG